MSSWIKFLHYLGRFLADESLQKRGRPVAFVSVPCIDFASIIAASGFITSRFADHRPVAGDVNPWRNRSGASVTFPFSRNNGRHNLKRRSGVVAGVDFFRGRERLMVRFLEQEHQAQTYLVDERWLPLVTPAAQLPNLQTWAGGSLLSEEITGLETLLGQEGVCRLLSCSHQSCLILDTKSRVQEEVRQATSLNSLGIDGASNELVLRDLVRLDTGGPEAMVETFSAQVSPHAAENWDLTILSGSLKFLREWHDCTSPVLLVILSPTENAYEEAVRFANELFGQRGEMELELPQGLLAIKPRSIDIQAMFTH